MLAVLSVKGDWTSVVSLKMAHIYGLFSKLCKSSHEY